VFILSGPPAAGKSTVARALCARFARAAHVDVDLLRWQMVASGYIHPEAASGRDLAAAGADAREARRQLDLASLNAATVARNFAVSGFTAVIDHVLEYRDELDLMLAYLDGLTVAFVTLMPDRDALRKRDEARQTERYVGQRALDLHRILGANGERRGIRLDTSTLTVDETVAAIMQRLDEAVVTPIWEMSG
jgi:chloramphenicol 3-O-phosphotransferase